ncbi:Ribosomal protein RSM22 (predicted rRNA methylase) [Hathewaya proteolytica DSM 3090]|uniref:Ribosomal protein RSM22 (Predicted rRNA methylase) n=1 Tax=Hathewaya proteolytica DSM 3090 TaxID=1121331 RepID=A0A1M6SUK9_9CLOT|nr:small ribosomal subunit Rsm22 family protein [Hathewaya proteolytica]SHK48258.1 Ribosomal protein RSM22 (predicted rRNA methylase) [Hathewaya proteolytica DSM 3090]
MIPEELQQALYSITQGLSRDQVAKDAENISHRYRNQSGKGKRLLTESTEAVAYALARMPATYGAVDFVFRQVFQQLHEDVTFHDMIDVGAGTGTVAWVMSQYAELSGGIACLEREKVMRDTANALGKYGSDNVKNAKWIAYDIVTDGLKCNADVVTASYVLNELCDEHRDRAVEKLWAATKKVLIIIEPGTPVGFNNIKKIRSQLIEKGATVIAPCVHCNECTKNEEDWCHFTARVGRTTIHRELKGGQCSYEDEKFSYIALAKEPCLIKPYKEGEGRILRHPQVRKGHILMELCTTQGIINATISKKDGEIYKETKKLNQGDKIFYKIC